MGSLQPWHFLIILAILGALVAVVAVAASTRRAPSDHQRQIVGYTPDGQPVMAYGTAGLAPQSARTNGLAIATLILSLVFTPVAIPLGHIARSQIRRTGEQGGGMALAGLIIAYIWLAAVVVVVLGVLASQ